MLRQSWPLYCKSMILVGAMTLGGEFVKRNLEPANLVMCYLLAVVIVAVRWGLGPAVFTSVLSVLAFDFFLVPPYLTLGVHDLQYTFTFAGLLIVGLIVGKLTAKTRRQALEATVRERRTATLYELSRNLAISQGLENTLEIIKKHLREIFVCDVALYLPEEQNLKVHTHDAGFPLNERELAMASLCFRSGQPSGKSADALQGGEAYYFPLRTAHGVTGVLGLQFTGPQEFMNPEESQLLEALSSQAALAIQQAKLAEEARQLELLRATEKLQKALLNSISHDLRTPLVSITGSLSILLHDASWLDEETRNELIENALEESERLNRIVGNLLDMTRVEAGALKASPKPCELRDVIGVSLQELKHKLSRRTLDIRIPHNFPEIPMDFSLMLKVFFNLIDNAVKYSSGETPIRIRAEIQGNKARIEISDEGAGIREEDLKRIFDKFYRAVKPGQISGTGLGLSICKGIVEAHNGEIWAESRSEKKGTTFIVLLPLRPQ